MSSNTAALVDDLVWRARVLEDGSRTAATFEKTCVSLRAAADALTAQAKELEEATAEIKRVKLAALTHIDEMSAFQRQMIAMERQRDEALAALKASEAREGELRAALDDAKRIERQTFKDAAAINAAAGSDAARDVLVERRRQVDAEGWTPDHDDWHTKGEMADAAALYASLRVRHATGLATWPWDAKWFKPTVGNRRRDLVKAGALILAEIERIDRARAVLSTKEMGR